MAFVPILGYGIDAKFGACLKAKRLLIIKHNNLTKGMKIGKDKIFTTVLAISLIIFMGILATTTRTTTNSVETNKTSPALTLDGRWIDDTGQRYYPSHNSVLKQLALNNPKKSLIEF